jgi:hypothetical protein
LIKMDAPIVMQHPRNVNNWILYADFRYKDGEEERVIPKGFVTDFASIPRLFWNLISPTQLGDVGPIKHDYVYRCGTGTREAADKQFLRDMEADGVKWWRRQSAYRMVRMFGGGSWSSGEVVIEELAAA